MLSRISALGKADIIVTGGSEAAICEAGVGGFNSMKALSERNDSPKQPHALMIRTAMDLYWEKVRVHYPEEYEASKTRR